MSRRIAHRPRYRNQQQRIPPSLHARQNLFYSRWAYRRQQLAYEKRPLGYGLSLIPFGYRLMKTLIVPYA
ncbi:MAG TPA: hypothetical protein VKR06_06025 [Ktedonosporobacter sp.]|nr:hypothetical protein [Ktedonosporobacter sp.]